MPLVPLLLLFFASGFCGLVYEIVWMRVLSLTLSVTVYAVTTVLCAFMGGLALGAWVAGRVADRQRRPARTFGLVEIGIGATGVLAPAVLFNLAPIEIWLHAQLGGAGILYSTARFLLAAAVLVVPTTLMGMTLPLLSRAGIERVDFVGRGAGGLYGVNALGAVVGCVAAGFFLIPALGLQSTSYVAAGVNLLLGATALAWQRRAPAREIPPAANDARPPSPIPIRSVVVALAFGVSGFTALGYEVLWTRALELFTHNSTYAYTAMLAVFLLGIGGGSVICARPADRLRRPLLAFGLLELGVGASVIMSLMFYMRFLDWIPAVTQALGGVNSWPRAVAMIVGVASVTLLGTTFLFGATFPFVARSVVDRIDAVGRRVAFAYTVNTLGSIAGALVVGFLTLPLLGMYGSFLLLIGLNLALGAGFAFSALPRPQGMGAIAAAAVAAAVAVFAIPSDLFKQVYIDRYGKVLMYREQITDIVMVTQSKGGRLIRFGDGRGTAGTTTFREDRSYAHIAMLAHANPRRILNICFGVGNSLASVALYPVERIDQVELSPGVVEAAPFFEKTNRGVLRDPRVHLTIQDGRNFLLTSPDRYDVIRLDPPELHTAGIVNLYTREFFEMARDHLAEGGIFSIWVNIAYTPERETRMILRTAAEVFPHVTVWHSPWLYSWVINGSVEPQTLDLGLIAKRFDDPRLKQDLASIPIKDPFAFLNYFVMADENVREFTKDDSVITDDRTVLDFTVPTAIESFYGISTLLVDQIDPNPKVFQRGAAYCRHKRPVWPRVVNGEAIGMTPDDVRRELVAKLGSQLGPGGCVGPAQTEAARQSQN